MRNFTSIIGAAGFLILLIIGGNQGALAQSPSTDVVPYKKAFLEFDFASHLEERKRGGYQVYLPRTRFGVSKNTEAGVNLAFARMPWANQPLEIQPNVKTRFYSNETKGVAAAAGAIFYIPVTHRAGADSFALVYSMVSKKIPGAHGPRLNAGGYKLLGSAIGTGTRAGAMLAYEQPLTPRFSFVTDWFSGRNRFGYITPSVLAVLSRRSLVYAGYSIGNQGRKNNGLVIRYGIMF
jgi:hypothetical protein